MENYQIKQQHFEDEEEFTLQQDEVLTELEENNSDSNGGEKVIPLREQDRFLPIANITKIMKRAVPENAKIAKDARECVQECISEFISFITSEASERCQTEKRKTINGEDVLFAMNTLGFDNYIEPMKNYLKKYREMVMAPTVMSKGQESSNKNVLVYTADGLSPFKTTESGQLEMLTTNQSDQNNFTLSIIEGSEGNPTCIGFKPNILH